MDNKDILFLQVNMKKIEGSERDYKLITILNDAFKTLSKEAQETINEVTETYVDTIKKIISADLMRDK
jgi:hypothetical protein